MPLIDHAQDRKDRLALLRSTKRKREHDTIEESSSGKDQAETKMRHRNYDPETNAPKLGYLANPADDVEDTVEGRAKMLVESTLTEDSAMGSEKRSLDLTSIQPKKPNWDLKRDLDNRLAKVQGKQSLIVAKLVRDKITALKAAGNIEAIHDIQGQDMSRHATMRSS